MVWWGGGGGEIRCDVAFPARIATLLLISPIALYIYVWRILRDRKWCTCRSVGRHLCQCMRGGGGGWSGAITTVVIAVLLLSRS